MGRGRGKGRKLTVSNHDDAGSGEEERIPAQKRRGRPQKPLKDDIDDEEMEKLEEDEEVIENGKVTTKDVKTPTAAASEDGKRRRRNSQQTKEKQESVKEEEANGVGAISTSTNDSTKSSGFRKNGSRRKSKPHRAAEAGVECRLSGLMT